MGCGVRVLSGERTGYAYTDDLSQERILHAAQTAAMIASGPAQQPIVGLTDKPAHNLYPVPLPSVEADVLAKVDLVQRADKAARDFDPRIHEVRVSYADELRRILVIGSDGSFAEDAQPLSRMSVFCIAKSEASGSARGSAGGGGRVALDYFQGEDFAGAFCQRSGAAGDHSTGCARSAGRRDGSGARPGMAGNSAA